MRRFSGMQIGLHVTIVTSFLLLAATGLPLKFAAGDLGAQADGDASAAPRSAGVLHRLAAVVTFGYFAWHLGMLAYGWFVKKERGYFWGPRSMTPQPRDILDLWAMVEVLPVHRAAAEVRPLHLLGEVRLPGGLLGRRGDRRSRAWCCGCRRWPPRSCRAGC